MIRDSDPERLADGREHPEREQVDLDEAKVIHVVLVPLQDRACVHPGGLDRRRVNQRVVRDHEPPHVDRGVAGKTLDLRSEVHQVTHRRVPRLNPGLLQPVLPRARLLVGRIGVVARSRLRARRTRHGVEAPRRGLLGLRVVRAHGLEVPERLRQRVDRVDPEPERLSYVSHGHLAAPRDDLVHHRRPVTAVLLVDVLQHLLAALVLEVDVDVWRLAALLRDETLKKQGLPGRVDRRDAQDEADGRVGGAATALAEDVAAAGELDDVVDREEVRREIQSLDDAELPLDLRAHLRRCRATVAPVHPPPGELLEPLLAGVAHRHDLVRVLVLQLIERK